MKRLHLISLVAGILGACIATGPAGAAPKAPAADSLQYRYLEEPAEGAYDLETTVRATGAGEARLCFASRNARTCDYLSLTRDSLTLMRVRGGKAAPLAAPIRINPSLSAAAAPLLVQRRPEKIAVVFRGVQVLQVGDVAGSAGQVGTAARGGIRLDPPRLQPVEAPEFTDDFMRGPDEPDAWEKAAGNWNTTTVGDVAKSANGFSFRGAGTPALAVTGYPFWEDYVFQASFRITQPEGAAGLCLYYQDSRNYLALVWGSDNGLRLLRVRGGKETILARKAVLWEPGQWYRLGVQARADSLTAFVDGKPCLEAQNRYFGRGKVALYASGREVYFDDVAVKPAVYLHDTAPAAHRDRWFTAGGLALTGSPSWSDYTLQARLRPQAGGIGLAFAWRSPDNYALFRWDGRGKQLLRIRGDKPVVVATAPGGYRPGRSYALSLSFQPGYAAVSVDNHRVLETADASLRNGAIGLTALSSGVSDLTVRLREEPPPPEEEITREFANSAAHPDMAEWANPARAWAPQTRGGVTVFWRKGAHFGDTDVTLPLAPPASRAALSLALAADGQTLASGYTFTIRRPEADKLDLTLSRRQHPVATVAIPLPKEPGELVLARRGSYLTASLGEKLVLKYRDPSPLEGNRVGLQSDGVNLDLKAVRVRARRGYDYTFHDAPTDWAPQAGIWEITNRWSCSPGWSWFGGKSESLAALWNKRRFRGDLVFEYYAAPKMDAVREDYQRRFRDMNATICADGVRLNSGYSFLIGGWDNSKTAILRGDRVVAETSNFHLPPQSAGHHSWFYVRIEKRGPLITLSVDNQPLLSYRDPAPLRGDRIALWTQNNGLMLSRAVIASEQEGDIPLVARAPALPAPSSRVTAAAAPLCNDFEQGLDQWRGVDARLSLDSKTAARGKKCLALTNAATGGEFKAVAFSGRFDAANERTLAFDYRVPPGVRVNIYLRVNGAYYAIPFTGEGKANPGASVVATLDGIANVCTDNTWRHAVYDLRAALRRVLPNAASLPVDEIVLANWDPADAINDAYVRAGVTANCLGARYRLDHFVIGQDAAPHAATAVKALASSQPPAIVLREVLREAFNNEKAAARWEPNGGRWQVTRAGQFAPAEKPEYASAFIGDRNWTDYTLKADLINGQDAGLCVRAQDWDNCVLLVIRPAHRDLWWFVRRNGEWGGVLSPTTLSFGPKPQISVKVDVSGETFTCFLDGQQVSQIKDATFRKGRIGVYIHPAEAGQAWDNIAVLQPRSAAR